VGEERSYDSAVDVAGLRAKLAIRRRAGVLLAPVAQVTDRIKGTTSATDASPYTRLCDRAATDPAVFATFKRHPDYVRVLEHVSRDEGAEYLRIALEQTPAFDTLLDRFRENDRLGGPQTFEYGGHGVFSPTTLRYVKVLSDLVALFGTIDRLSIVEIGAGYGGQCFVTKSGSSPESYKLVDLDPVIRLQRAYLEALDVASVEFVVAGELTTDLASDLVVSNYAFTECVREVQENYLSRVLQQAPRGYVTCNWTSRRHFRSLSPEELLEAIPGSRFLPEVPLTAPKNRIWVWGNYSSAPSSSEPVA
jgi:putative sugar O-methyltransferase